MSTQILDTRTKELRATFIPINKLTIHESNVRRTDKRANIEALAASIEAHGLLQNLTVVARENDRYAVVAGGRRLAALKLLAKAGRIARDFAAPCSIIGEDAGGEASLAENLQRVAMNVMDEVDAFAVLLDGGASVDDIARRFGATLRYVEQRLALARLSPKIKAAYRKGEVSLDAARAFCITDEHARQEAVFRQMAKPIVQGANVRAHLTQGRVPARDRLAILVGLEAYEAAGGRIVRDLFEEGVAFLDDADLLRRLASEKAESWRDALLAEGWGWVEINLGHARFEGTASERLHPTRRPLVGEEAANLEQLTREIAALDDDLADADGDDPRFDERDRLDAERDALLEGAAAWDAGLMKHAGVVISIDHDGRPAFAKGLIKRGDVKVIAKLRSKTEERVGATPNGDAEATTADDDPAPSGPQMSRAVVERLTGARTRALRSALCQKPHTALALLVHALSARSGFGAPVHGVDIVNRPVAMDDTPAMRDRRAVLSNTLDGGDLLPALLATSTEALVDALAVFVAETLDLTHGGVGPHASRSQALADTLAIALDLDMTQCWAPDLDFWMHLPKAMIIEALNTAPRIAVLPAAERAAMATAFAKMKKSELAVAAAQALEGSGWLPGVLVTPDAGGEIKLTEAGRAAVEAITDNAGAIIAAE
jgi:ParB family chromosome partitioning protein